MQPENQAYAFFLGWTLIILALWGMVKTRTGNIIVYYLLWGSIVLLLITHGDEITTIFTQSGLLTGKGQ